jgi:hypothetical protein
MYPSHTINLRKHEAHGISISKKAGEGTDPVTGPAHHFDYHTDEKPEFLEYWLKHIGVCYLI